MQRLVALLLIPVALFVAWRVGVFEPAKPCADPITYAVGFFDRRFDISQKDFLAALTEAEATWERPSGLNLFTYAPENGDLKVNLIYDYRQEVTEELNKLESGVKEDESDYKRLEANYLRQKAEYEVIKKVYDSEVAQLDEKSSVYEAHVKAWNESSRTSKKQFEALEEERLALEKEFEKVKALEDELNQKVRDLNALVGRLNRLAKTLNLNVDEYNTIGALRGETFAGGIYSSSVEGEKIDIYEFGSKNKLVRILAHELGHALGLEHIADPKAIMYKLNQGEAGVVTPSDLRALEVLCSAK